MIVSGWNKCWNTLLDLSQQEPLHWPVVQMVISKVSDEGMEKAYRGWVLSWYTVDTQAKADLRSLEKKIRDRLEWSDMKLLRSILVFLDTRSWAMADASSEHDSEDKSRS